MKDNFTLLGFEKLFNIEKIEIFTNKNYKERVKNLSNKIKLSELQIVVST